MKRTVILTGAMMLFMLSACGTNNEKADIDLPTGVVATNHMAGADESSVPVDEEAPEGADDGDISADGIYDIERIYTDTLFCRIMEGDEIPLVVIYGLGGEGGYVSAMSDDPETVNGFIEALREVKIKSTTQDPDDFGYTADGGEDIVFGMKDNTKFSIALDGRVRIHGNGVVFEIENTQKLSEMCLMMQHIAYLNDNGGTPYDGYFAVIHGGVGEQTCEAYVYEKDNAYEYIIVESTTVSWGSTQWNHEVKKIGTADTKEEVIEKAAGYGADSFVMFPGDNDPHPISEL